MTDNVITGRRMLAVFQFSNVVFTMKSLADRVPIVSQDTFLSRSSSAVAKFILLKCAFCLSNLKLTKKK